ncbi:MAG: endonuclease domain-containing protein [Xanthomonadaceae bacterium]|nr:endonuclease domain-containing protein [Xanthomonadaceae bacterium]MDE2084922.1 endonuclease domain-containing protein [Xanthomonadaceae bacterium]
MSALLDPRQAQAFRFVRCTYHDGEAQLVYAFDNGSELIERIGFPDAPALPAERKPAFAAALRLLHLIAGVSYYKAGVPNEIAIEGEPLDAGLAQFMDTVYTHGLAEFAYHNKVDLRGRIRFPRHDNATQPPATRVNLPRRTLVPIGGGKDSLVSVEMLKRVNEPMSAVWVGDSALIASCAQRTGLPTLNLKRRLAPELFEYNRLGAYNGHIPVTAINSAILICAAILYGFDAIAFSNEASASAATLEYDGQPVNHQWSKSLDFERGLREYTKSHIAADLDYFSVLRPWSELAVTRAFAHGVQYDGVFSSCNRNFRIRGEKPADRWCGQCPKCHFVFLALAPFVAKPRLLAIFGRNLLDDAALAPGFDALLEYREHKPFECVGEGRESRAAMQALSLRPEWREDALVARFAEEIAPQLGADELALAPLLTPSATHFLPFRLQGLLHAHA